MHDAAVIHEHFFHSHQSLERLKQIQDMEPSTVLTSILHSADDFFHNEQQTNKMLQDHSRRSRLSYENHRKALLPRLVDHGSSFYKTNFLSTDVNPFDVTLTMQIYDDYQGTLYKRRTPDSLAKIMRETNTLIRFPDRGAQGVAGCQVLIKGSLRNVEHARVRVRLLSTITISFFSEENNKDLNIQELESLLKDQINKKKLPKNLEYEVVPPQNKQLYDKATIKITGTFSQEDTMVHVINLLRKELFESLGTQQILILSELTVPVSQMEMFLGGEHAEQLVAIAKSANVYLHFMPIQNNYSNCPSFHNFIISGTEPEKVIHALKIMTALQPVQLSFNVLGEDIVQKIERSATKKYYDDKHRVFINICPSIKQIASFFPEDPVIHFICITAQEYNVAGMYTAMKAILQKPICLNKVFPRCKAPEFISRIGGDLLVAAHWLDIQNFEFPDAILSSVNEKGDSFEKTGEIEDSDENVIVDSETRVGDSEHGLYDVMEHFGSSHLEHFGFPLHELNVAKDISNYRNDYRFDMNSFGSLRGSYPRGYRGNRRGGVNYYGDRRNSTYPRRGYQRDRENGGKPDYGRSRISTISESEKVSNYGHCEDENPRREKWNTRKSLTRSSIDEYSLRGYVNYYINQNYDFWKKPFEKTLLRKRNTNSQNSTMDDEAEIPKRMSAKDLIDKATEELSSGSTNTSQYSDNSRISYARVVERARKTEQCDISSSDNLSTQQLSCSIGRSDPQKYPVNRDSPFSNGVRHLDRRVDVDHVLFSINCDKYMENFQKNNIQTLPKFLKLEESDLLKIGVGSILDRKTIMEYVHKLRQAQARVNPSTSTCSVPVV